MAGYLINACLYVRCPLRLSLSIKAFFDDIGVFDESLPACEDYDLWLRITCKYEVAYESKPCINKYGGHDDQLSRQFWGMDRFRVSSLEKVLKQDLQAEYYEAALSTLISKLTILKNGAQKRKNHELVSECNLKLATWISL